MNGREAGFLLLTSQLGDPERKPLTVAQFRTLASRVRASVKPKTDRELEEEDLIALGYSREMAERILHLLGERQLLDYYLRKGKQRDCFPITRAGEQYPIRVRKCLGDDSPGCLWAKGDISILHKPCVALVGSRELNDENRRFAEQVGMQAAKQGFVLVSGNARGADKTAQEACLRAGGNVICVVADSLEKHKEKDSVLYLSEDGYNNAFSSQRALSRNRIIHSLSPMTFVAQSSMESGGTWSGTTLNLNCHWSSVFCFDDGSPAACAFSEMGAQLVTISDLNNLAALKNESMDLLIE